MYPWKEMYSMSTYSSAFLFSDVYLLFLIGKHDQCIKHRFYPILKFISESMFISRALEYFHLYHYFMETFFRGYILDGIHLYQIVRQGFECKTRI